MRCYSFFEVFGGDCVSSKVYQYLITENYFPNRFCFCHLLLLTYCYCVPARFIRHHIDRNLVNRNIFSHCFIRCWQSLALVELWYYFVFSLVGIVACAFTVEKRCHYYTILYFLIPVIRSPELSVTAFPLESVIESVSSMLSWKFENRVPVIFAPLLSCAVTPARIDSAFTVSEVRSIRTVPFANATLFTVAIMTSSLLRRRQTLFPEHQTQQSKLFRLRNN
nr:MAG TPA: hypothetical protein [Ackermannviridae sp.]